MLMDGFAALWLAVFVLGIATAFGGRAELVIPRLCMETVALTEASECHGPDKGHMKCTGLILTVKSGCEQLRVTQ